jgi:hypothetical protein
MVPPPMSLLLPIIILGAISTLLCLLHNRPLRRICHGMRGWLVHDGPPISQDSSGQYGVARFELWTPYLISQTKTATERHSLRLPLFSFGMLRPLFRHRIMS